MIIQNKFSIYYLKMKKNIILIISLFFLACTNTNQKKNFYKTGELKSIINLDENYTPNGIYKRYYKSGRLKAIGRYKNGKLDDKFLNYYESGKIEEIGTYKNGKLIDTLFSYYKLGGIKSKGVYNNLKPIGWWTYYNQNGFISHKSEYLNINGKIVENQSIYYSDEEKINREKSSYFVIELKDTLSLGKSIGKIKYFSKFLKNERYLSVVIDNLYGKDIVKKDTFAYNQDSLRFGVYAYKKGELNIKGELIETILNEKYLGGGKSELEVLKIKKFFNKKVYIK